MTNSNQSVPSPNTVLFHMVQGLMVSKALQAVAELRIADLLADSPKTADDLAQKTSTNPSALVRLLRALTGIGVFRLNENGRFENSALSELLRTDNPGTLRDYVLYSPNDGNVRAWMRLISVLRTGEPSFAAANGSDLWEYQQQNHEVGDVFNRAMTSLLAASVPAVLQAYDFSPFKSVIDVGGGQGLFLAGILKANPHVRGTLFELPSVTQGAAAYLARQGIAGRYDIVAGDAFKSIPGGFDAYIFKNVIHDWSDEKASALLANCRAVIPPRSKLIIVDSVMVPGNNPHASDWMDVHMMVALGGKERTEGEFRILLRRAGFALRRAKSLEVPATGVVEAVPV